MEKTIWIIAVHSISGVLVDKLEFSDKDEEYLDDIQEWDSFDDYVEYNIDDRVSYLERLSYAAVAVENEERLDIIKELNA